MYIYIQIYIAIDIYIDIYGGAKCTSIDYDSVYLDHQS